MSATAVVGKALITAIVVLALGGTAGSVDAGARPAYPPTQPCALWVSGRAASSWVRLVLVGSGLGSAQRVDVVMDPSATRIGSFRTDVSGAFTAVLTLPAERVRVARQLTAASATASCSVRPPQPGQDNGSPPSAPSPSRTAGVTPGNGPGSGPTAGRTSPSPAPDASPTPASSTPLSPSQSGPVPSSSASPAQSQPSKILGLGLSIWITMVVALGLIIIGGLAVLLLTRRSS